MSHNSEISQTEENKADYNKAYSQKKRESLQSCQKDRQDGLNEVSRRQESAQDDHKDEQGEYLSAIKHF